MRKEERRGDQGRGGEKGKGRVSVTDMVTLRSLALFLLMTL